MKPRLLAAAAAAALVVALTSCSAPPDAESTDTASAAASAPASAPPSEATPTTEPEPVPSCLQIDTTEPTVDGTTLGTCISDALPVIGTFKATSDMSGEPQEVEIRLRPDVALHGRSPDNEVIYLDDIAYTNEGDGWVKGDIGSDDPEEYVAGAAGLALLTAFAGDVLKQSIAACPVWNIEVASKKITLPDSTVVDSRVFSCAAPFESFGMTVSPMNVWIGADWTPYGYESTVTGLGQIVEGVSFYYDHGVPVEIVAPV
ncbi:hypothetical protein [Microbacterium sp.]|uniref:hypothetical protein n=1 Tax=Microbacterium sp. TaxID=51671 RepID=UPI0039E6DC87